jgi:hypothetical protein
MLPHGLYTGNPKQYKNAIKKKGEVVILSIQCFLIIGKKKKMLFDYFQGLKYNYLTDNEYKSLLKVVNKDYSF